MMGQSLANVILPPLLVWVVLSDLLYRRISNRIVLVLLVGWFAASGWLAWSGAFTPSWSGALSCMGAALGVLVVGYVLFAMRWVGAGDVKLMAVLCLWMAGNAFTFLMVTALAGGVLALVLPQLRWLETGLANAVMRMGTLLPTARTWPTPMALQPEPVAGIPYGLAIAFGAAFVLFAH